MINQAAAALDIGRSPAFGIYGQKSKQMSIALIVRLMDSTQKEKRGHNGEDYLMNSLCSFMLLCRRRADIAKKKLPWDKVRGF